MIFSLSFFWDKYIKWIVIIYFTLVWTNFNFKWLSFEEFEVHACKSSLSKHAKLWYHRLLQVEVQLNDLSSPFYLATNV